MASQMKSQFDCIP